MDRLLIQSEPPEMSQGRLICALFDSIEHEPEAERPLLRKIAFVLGDIDKKLTSIKRDVRDCTVITVRTLGRLEQFKMESVRNNG